MKKKLAPHLIAVLLLGFTLLGAITTYKRISKQEEIIAESAHRQVIREIVNRMGTYENVLLQTRSMFYVTKEVDRREFAQYVKKLEILKNYPGIQGIGFALGVKPNEINLHELRIRKEVPSYRVWPEGRREIYFPIIYLEPQDWRNQRAQGYDMFSEPNRQQAMRRAIEEDAAILSDPVELVQETEEDPQIGFLMYVPVYSRDEAYETKQERMDEVVGLVYSPFRARDLFEQIMKNLPDLAVDVEVRFAGKTLFNRVAVSKSNRQHGIRSDLELAGKTWEVTTFPLPGLYPGSESKIPILILIFGFLLTGVVFFFLLRLRHQTEELEERSQTLQQIQDATRILSSKLELKEVLQSLTDIGLELSKAEFGAFFYNTIDEKGESLMLYTLSGVDRSKFEKFPMPRNTAVFAPTFGGETLLSSDITKDSRFGKNTPYNGLPEGHLPVKSYLAVAVKSKSGEAIGALFYGHSTAGCFTERHKDLIEGLSQQAAIAIDNATLFQNAQRAIATREEFLNIASHELKTPITSMMIQYQSAERMIKKGIDKVFSEESVKKRVGISLRQLDKMLKLIEEMLDSSRISLGKFEVKMEVFDIRQMTKELIERYEEQFRARNISVVTDLGSEENVEYLGDEYRLEQVFSNLLNNAIKYGLDAPVEIHLRWSEKDIQFSVKDNGQGISEENLPKIFERYERLVSSTNVSGLGLGLYISKNIVEAHRGEIKVESGPGKGSVFTVILPR